LHDGYLNMSVSCESLEKTAVRVVAVVRL
jgi:hypothetical protein